MSSQLGADVDSILSPSGNAEKLFHPNRTRSEWVENLQINDPSMEDVLRVVFDLRTQAVATYAALLEAPGQTTQQLATEFDRDRSNVNRWLSELQEAGLVFRNRRIPETGGFFYEYHPVPDSLREEILTDAVEQWTQTAVAAIAEAER